MRTKLSVVALALLVLSVLACGSGGSTLAAASADDGGDATTSDAPTTDVALSSDGLVDAVAEAGTDAPVGQVDATAVEAGNAAASDAGDAASDAGNNAAEAGPYMGSLPTAATSALIRFANWSPDSPAFDMCIAPHGTTSFQGPLLSALAAATGSDAGSAGLAFPLVSAYTLVPPGQYDARIV